MARISAAAKDATRQRIIAAACRLFDDRGFRQATTRDIAAQAGIAAGTLFNYFPNKEAIVITLVAGGLEQAGDDFFQQRRADASLEEDLFHHVSSGLRRLKPYRKFLGPAVELSLSPLVRTVANEQAEAIRVGHLEAVTRIAGNHGLPPPSAIALHLYWTLYTGVFAFWISDSSPHQEDTLAMLDQSLSMFVRWLRDEGGDAPPAESGIN